MNSVVEPIGSMTASGEDRSAYWLSGGNAEQLVAISGTDVVTQVAVEEGNVAISYGLGSSGSPIPPTGLTIWNSESGIPPRQIVPRPGVEQQNNTGGVNGLIWYGNFIWYARIDSSDPTTILLMRYDTVSNKEILVAKGASDKMAIWNGTIVSVAQADLSLRQFNIETGEELEVDPRLVSFTNVDQIEAEGDSLVFQVRTGDDETNQYWIVTQNDQPQMLVSNKEPNDDEEGLLGAWRDFSPIADGFVVARGNYANIVIDLRTRKWTAMPEAYDAWTGHLLFVDATSSPWNWQAVVPTTELARLDGCATRPPELLFSRGGY